MKPQSAKHRPIDDCPHCEGEGGRREEHCPVHGVGASLAAEDAFFRKQNQLDRQGRCQHHPQEVKGQCQKCKETDSSTGQGEKLAT